ncbi:MAG: histidine kinase N-terminal domain-containing protein, partial [Propionicimonas sp.]|nr:histidine kinase N-terminal domain-containing protein [Propionicimonas sp.]
MLTMEQVIGAHTVLSDEDQEWLARLVDDWSLLADLSFADLILWVPGSDENVFWAAAQVRPTTGPTSLEDDVVGEEIVYDPEHLVTEAFLSFEICHASGNSLQAGIPVDVKAIPILRGD